MDNIEVVLADTKDSGNVGAVCRGMKNMGVRRLALAGDRPYDDERIVTLAVHAADVYADAVRFPDLKSAVTDSILTVGVTRRRGRWRKYRSFTPEELAKKLLDFGEGTVSLVFGNEEHGLTDGELKACDAAVHIPSSPDFPSLNLSHAVQLVLYVIFREFSAAGGGSVREKEYAPSSAAAREVVDRAVSSAVDDLEAIGFFTLTGREEMHIYLRDLLARAHPDIREAERFAGLFTKIRDLKLHRRE
jgi:tRNA/rRNA methyltransferase